MPVATSTQVVSRSDRSEHWTESPIDRIAIVGGGPRGLYCLESLVGTLVDDPRAIEVVLYEPNRCLGAGPIYDPAQPAYLRMNFAARHIDAWSSRSPDRPAFFKWAVSQGLPVKPDDYVPRAWVGRYLQDCFEQVLDHVRKFGRVEIISHTVSRIDRAHDRWRVVSEASDDAFDEVIVTTGHGGWRRSSHSNAFNVATIYPPDIMLSPARVPPQSNVEVCGFALTAIDCCLALTEGRGGRFDFTTRCPTYRPSGREPATIQLTSRTGRPMWPKPTGEVVDQLACLMPIWEAAESQLTILDRRRGEIWFDREVLPIVLDAVEKSAKFLDFPDEPAISDQFANWSANRMTPAEAVRTMRSGYLQACGDEPLSRMMVLGEAWRRLYKPIVHLLSYGGLDDANWSIFQSMSAELERIAFGPPADNLGRMLALIDSGHVVPSRTAGVEEPTAGEGSSIRVDGRIPGPTQFSRDSVLSRLTADGLIQQHARHRGLIVSEDGEAVSPDGRRVSRLFIFGRATEGCVIGNDTLSRTLHNDIRNWSRGLGERSSRSKNVVR